MWEPSTEATEKSGGRLEGEYLAPKESSGVAHRNGLPLEVSTIAAISAASAEDRAASTRLICPARSCVASARCPAMSSIWAAALAMSKATASTCLRSLKDPFVPDPAGDVFLVQVLEEGKNILSAGVEHIPAIANGDIALRLGMGDYPLHHGLVC